MGIATGYILSYIYTFTGYISIYIKLYRLIKDLFNFIYLWLSPVGGLPQAIYLYILY